MAAGRARGGRGGGGRRRGEGWPGGHTHHTESGRSRRGRAVAAGCDYGGDLTPLCTQAAQRRRRPGFCGRTRHTRRLLDKMSRQGLCQSPKDTAERINYASLLPDASVCRGRLGPRNGGAKNTPAPSLSLSLLLPPRVRQRQQQQPRRCCDRRLRTTRLSHLLVPPLLGEYRTPFACTTR